jgi:hypothetical protein
MSRGTIILRQDAAKYYRELQAIAQQMALREGRVLLTELGEGEEVQEIVECVQRTPKQPVGRRHTSTLVAVEPLVEHDARSSKRVGSSILAVH